MGWIGQQWAWLLCVPPCWWVLERPWRIGFQRSWLWLWPWSSAWNSLGPLLCFVWVRCRVSGRPARRAAVRGHQSVTLQALPARSLPTSWLGVLGLLQVSLQALPPVHRGSPGCPLEPLHSPFPGHSLSTPNMMTSVKILCLSKAPCAGPG